MTDSNQLDLLTPISNGNKSTTNNTQVADVRIYSDGMYKNYKQGWISAFVAVTTLLLYMAWIHILIFILVASIWIPWLRPVLCALYATLLLPRTPLLWEGFLKSHVFTAWRQYFQYSYLFEEINEDVHAIFAEYPHGVFPMSQIVAGTLMPWIFPGFKIYGMAASVLFKIPGYRHFFAWSGSVDATRENFKKYLKLGSVAVVPGGIAEMYLQHPKKEIVKLKGRYGFVKIAVEEGVPIVPVYHFGNTQVLNFGPRWLAPLSRKLRMSLGITYGRFGIPWPRRVPLYMVTGKLVKVNQKDKSDPGFDAEVERVHAEVVKALQKVYDDHKAEYGWQDRPLEII